MSKLCWQRNVVENDHNYRHLLFKLPAGLPGNQSQLRTNLSTRLPLSLWVGSLVPRLSLSHAGHGPFSHPHHCWSHPRSKQWTPHSIVLMQVPLSGQSWITDQAWWLSL